MKPRAFPMACAFLVAAGSLPAQTGDVLGVHDPSIIRAGEVWWVFSTGMREGTIAIRTSRDLFHWESRGFVFAAPPAWTREFLGRGRSLWAPDISRHAGEYRLYYSASSFGSQRSGVGLVVTRGLDPADPRGGWEDRGKVLESRPGVDDFNAIDPQAIEDEEGRPWLALGSFWGGIRLFRLDPETGLLAAEDAEPIPLARRGGDGAVEAPFIVRAMDRWYLFVSFDRCCRGVESSYKIVVGRASKLQGPYVDRDGKPLLLGGGTLVLEGKGRFRGPGHNAVLRESGRDWLVHHAYDAEERGRAKLQIRPLEWSPDGWPLAGEAIEGPPLEAKREPPKPEASKSEKPKPEASKPEKPKSETTTSEVPSEGAKKP